ncbi:MAG: hypothetical protein KME27_10770 [Lyngbya sp. HA4199-MV5]|jgi:hypothetical protein|nr:hypothetical protein [Lyngbya sp. HA4199-MV5]
MTETSPTSTIDDMPPTDAQKMERIDFAVPKPLLDEAIAMAKEDGFKPAEFFRQVWLDGLFAYAEKSNKVLVNRKLRRQATETDESK